MQEIDLINAGFEKQTVSNEESGNGYDYYYYFLELCEGISLKSEDNDVVKDGNWIITSFDIPALNIETVEHLNAFLELIATVTDCKNV